MRRRQPDCPCRICAGEGSDPAFDDHDRKLIDDVERHGWHIVGIRAEDGIPGWAFTAGLTHTLGQPELVVSGLAQEVMSHSLNIAGAAASEGDRLEPGKRMSGNLEGHDIELRPVHRDWHQVLFGYAIWFYRRSAPNFLQCVWPDRSGRFPWEGDFDATLARFQPQLWEAPSLAPAGPWRAYWAASDWPGRENVNGLVFVSKRAHAGEAPVLCVKVFADGDWRSSTAGRPSRRTSPWSISTTSSSATPPSSRRGRWSRVRSPGGTGPASPGPSSHTTIDAGGSAPAVGLAAR